MIRFEVKEPEGRLLCDTHPRLRIGKTSLSFGEGPLWDESSQSLLFVDIIQSHIWRWSVESGGMELIAEDTGHANGLAFDRSGRLVAAGWSSRSIWRLEVDGSRTVLASHYQGVRLNTPNDLIALKDGNILFTDSDGGLFIPGMEGADLQRYLPYSGVYALLASGELKLLVSDCCFPNGIALSPDGRRVFVSDTLNAHVRSFALQPGPSLESAEVFYEVDGKEPGHADGMVFDREGNLYCTGPGGIHIVSPSGALIARLLVAEDCTNMAWGGRDMRTLFITTFHSVLAVDMNVSGLRPGEAIQ